MPKVYGSYKHGEDILKDGRGYYIIQWNKTKQAEVKKHLKTLKRHVVKSTKRKTRKTK
jgi:hypothetical protein